MATNSYNNAVHITKAALAVIEGDGTLIKNVRRDDKEFAQDGTAQAGSTRNIRVPGYGQWREGKVASPSALNDTFIPVSVTQGGADFIVTSEELALNIDDLQQVLRPRISTVISQLDYELWLQVQKIGLITGTGVTNTLPTKVSAFNKAKALTHLVGGAPKDGTHSAVLHELAMASVIDGTSTVFNPTQEIARQYREGNMGYAAGMKWSTDRNAQTHVGGVWAGSPVMNGTTLDGATQFVTSTWTSGASTLNAGDVYTVDGVYAVDRVSKKSTGLLKQWCVATTVSDSGGAMTIVNTETLVASGPNQNVDSVPLTSARVRPFYATGAVAQESLVLHPDGLVFATAVLPDMGQNCVRMKAPDLNLSIRVYEYTDGRTDEKLWRLDVLRGSALGRPGFACRVVG